MNVERRGRNPNRGNGNRGKSKNGRSQSRNGQSRNGQGVVCWNCGKPGHIKKYCKEPKKNAEKNGDKKDDEANVVTEEVRDALLLTVDNSCESWIIDSGASFHTTACRDVLENYVAGNHGKVYLADGEPLDIVGFGDVRLKMPNALVWNIHKVRHVPGLQKSDFSGAT